MKSDNLAEFGRYLRDLREKAGLSGAELARLSGLHPSQISNFENGERRAGDSVAQKLARGLKLDEEQTRELVHRALLTSLRPRVMNDLQGYHPAILGELAEHLRRNGLGEDDIATVISPRGNDGMNADTRVLIMKLAEKLEQKAKGLKEFVHKSPHDRDAIGTPTQVHPVDLVLTTKAGKIVLIEITTAG